MTFCCWPLTFFYLAFDKGLVAFDILVLASRKVRNVYYTLVLASRKVWVALVGGFILRWFWLWGGWFALWGWDCLEGGHTMGCVLVTFFLLPCGFEMFFCILLLQIFKIVNL